MAQITPAENRLSKLYDEYGDTPKVTSELLLWAATEVRLAVAEIAKGNTTIDAYFQENFVEESVTIDDDN